MIGISKLYCGTVEPSDAIRYGRHSKDLPSELLQFSADKKPVDPLELFKQKILSELQKVPEGLKVEAKDMINDIMKGI